MDLFDQLIAESKAEVKVKKAAGVAVPARVFVESDYTAVQHVAMFNEVGCARCSAVEVQFEGLFEVRKHRRTSDTHWVKLSVPPFTQTMPRIKQYREHSVPYCDSCCDIATYKDPE